MEKDESIAVKDAVLKVQLALLEGVQSEDKLFAAGSLMSRSDYQDVVTERSIANSCGYPLCGNPLPAERTCKGRFRISLKEHKVYDLHETYMYCSTSCVVNSRAFAGSLPEERCSVLNPAMLNKILRLFEGLRRDSKEDLVRDGDLGFSKLKIQENADAKVEEVSLEDWVGPSDAIEGYIPQRDRMSKFSHVEKQKEGKSHNSHVVDKGSRQNKLNKEKRLIFNEMDFKSAIITPDEYNISKPAPSGSKMIEPSAKLKERKRRMGQKEMENQFTILEIPSVSVQSRTESTLNELKQEENTIATGDKLSVSEPSGGSHLESLDVNVAEVKEEFDPIKAAGTLKPCIKYAGAKKAARSVTWADKSIESTKNGSLCEVQELEHTKESSEKSRFADVEDSDKALLFASAEACAIALTQAAEVVASGEIDVSDAMSEAGIIVLPPPHDVDETRSLEDADMLEPDQASVKWPDKPRVPNYNLFDSEDSWYDSPPEGFSLTLSPFATMWMSLFAWISSSSLAFIYGRDESFHEDFLSVNGREYPRKIVLTEGRSSEIKQTLAGCLARALPGLIADLRLPTTISTLEQGMSCLLDTMSFVDPLPAFRMKQWQVIVLLFIEALSVSRIHALSTQMTNRRMFLHKVLDGAQISVEEYETMKDLIIPLGRVPEFSMQSGG